MSTAAAAQQKPQSVPRKGERPEQYPPIPTRLTNTGWSPLPYGFFELSGERVLPEDIALLGVIHMATNGNVKDGRPQKAPITMQQFGATRVFKNRGTGYIETRMKWLCQEGGVARRTPNGRSYEYELLAENFLTAPLLPKEEPKAEPKAATTPKIIAVPVDEPLLCLPGQSRPFTLPKQEPRDGFRLLNESTYPVLFSMLDNGVFWLRDGKLPPGVGTIAHPPKGEHKANRETDRHSTACLSSDQVVENKGLVVLRTFQKDPPKNSPISARAPRSAPDELSVLLDSTELYLREQMSPALEQRIRSAMGTTPVSYLEEQFRADDKLKVKFFETKAKAAAAIFQAELQREQKARIEQERRPKEPSHQEQYAARCAREIAEWDTLDSEQKLYYKKHESERCAHLPFGHTKEDRALIAREKKRLIGVKKENKTEYCGIPGFGDIPW